MIKALLCETCSIKRRHPYSGDSFNEYDYYTIENVECIGLRLSGKEKENNYSKNTVVDVTLFLQTELYETDMIVYNSYEYKITISGIEKRKNLITGAVEFYVVSLERVGVYPKETVPIKRR